MAAAAGAGGDTPVAPPGARGQSRLCRAADCGRFISARRHGVSRCRAPPPHATVNSHPRRATPAQRRVMPSQRRTTRGQSRTAPSQRRVMPSQRRSTPSQSWTTPSQRRVTPGQRRARHGPRRARDGPCRASVGPCRARDVPRRARDRPCRARDGPRRARVWPRRSRDGSYRARDAAPEPPETPRQVQGTVPESCVGHRRGVSSSSEATLRGTCRGPAGYRSHMGTPHPKTTPPHPHLSTESSPGAGAGQMLLLRCYGPITISSWDQSSNCVRPSPYIRQSSRSDTRDIHRR